jgi:hypothetical protein
MLWLLHPMGLLTILELQMTNSHSGAPQGGRFIRFMRRVGRGLCTGLLLIGAVLSLANGVFDSDFHVSNSAQVAAVDVSAVAKQSQQLASFDERSIAKQPMAIPQKTSRGRDATYSANYAGHAASRLGAVTLRETGFHVFMDVIFLKFSWTFVFVALALLISAKLLRRAAQHFASLLESGPAPGSM